ncbi:MAG: hypothetical protein RJA70_1600 [Pseudomonadota bacterium]|jgi:type III secretory pathway component EscT
MNDLTELLRTLERNGVSLEGWLLAWARLLPTVVLVPAFGGRFLPASARAVLGLSLGFTLAPMLVVPPSGQWLAVSVLTEMLHGLPLAVSVAALMWAAMMAGGLLDDLRGASQPAQGPFSEASTPLGTLLGLFAAIGFLRLGGAPRLVEALSRETGPHTVLGAVGNLVSAIEVALALAAPMLVALIVWEVAGALVARSAAPAHIQSLLAPLRSLVVLGALAISADALFALLSRLMARDL